MFRSVKSIVFLSIVSVLLFACGMSEQEKEVNDLYEAVQATHDTAMSKMSQLEAMKEELMSRKTSWEADTSDTTGTIQMKITKADQLMEQLESSRTAMMNWMGEFDDPREKPYEESKPYLDDQNKKVKEIQTSMSKSINEAETFLEK